MSAGLIPQELIRKKRDGHSLTASELKAFVDGYLAGNVADYQMAAMLMAIYWRGMDASELATFTRLSRDSGVVFDWPGPTHHVVDKHSTGGVGDKTSLLILPLALLEGLRVPMIAGRGLGHTGGTLDKLESIGVDVFLNVEQAREQMETLGGFWLGQTEQMVPLDRRLYALRDVTATVESIPLIVASILSKKLAEGLGGLVMDVKFGSGAFLPELPRARELAQSLVAIGKECSLPVHCLLTSMDSPLGDRAGNALEVHECIEILRGGGPESTRELSLRLTEEMVAMAFPERHRKDIKASLEENLASGRAFEMFRKLVRAQGGDESCLDEPAKLLKAPVVRPITVGAGVVERIDVRALGLAILELGGGRRLASDKIDPWVGLSGMKRVGDEVERDEPVAFVHARDEATAAHAGAIVAKAYVVAEGAEVASHPLIREVLA